MFACGDQVKLPHGRGVGIVIESNGGESDVFEGRRADMTPIVVRYVDCELAYTGRHLGKIGRLVRAELREPKARGHWTAQAHSGT